MKGTLHQDGRDYLLRFERFYPHPCDEVWAALVEPSRLAEWFPAAIEGERRAGASLRFVFAGDEGPALEGQLRIFEPPRLLEYTWGSDVLRWALTPASGGCSLVFTSTVAQRSNAPRDATGWEGCLGNLGAVLSGTATRAIAPDEFAERYREYVAAFGKGAFPDFLVVGSPEAGSAPLLDAPGLSGQTYAAPSGARFSVLCAANDAEIAPHALAGDAYVYVIEGSYSLRLGEHELTLPAGTELHVPGGGRVSGRIAAGSRMFYAIAPDRAR
jgi:uncharacterized protein YndB with AHSA1/START domain